MASPEWLEIYRSYSNEQLATEIADLKSVLAPKSAQFAAQQVGQKSYTKAELTQFAGRLSAAVRIQKERATAGNPYIGVTDFSGINGC